MSVIHGNDLLILNSIGTALIAGAKSCEIEMQCDVIETSNALSAGAKTYLAGRKDWTINIGYLVQNPLTELPMVGQTVTVRVKVRGSNSYLSGSAIVQTCRVTGTRGSLATGTFVLKGSGALS